MVLKMTLDDIKDKVPSNVTVQTYEDEDDDSIDVLVNNTYTGYLYDTPEGMYFKTLWIEPKNWDDLANVKTFLSRFKYVLLFTFRYHRYTQRIYRLIK